MRISLHFILAGNLAALLAAVLASGLSAAPQCPHSPPPPRDPGAVAPGGGGYGGPKLPVDSSGPETPGTRGPGTPPPPNAGPRPRPTTPGGSVTSGTPRTARGVVMVLTRGRTSKERLRIDWKVPVYVAEQTKHTGPAPVLSRDEAFSFLRKDDRRPLLVLRECHMCSGSDLALLSRATNNERTMLLTTWFHCVKLPSTVLRRDHALRNLFPGKRPPHLFFATNDGETVLNLTGNQTPSQVWKGMAKILRQTYRGDSASAVRRLLGLLDEFDTVDAKLMDLRRRLDTTLEKHGPASAQFKNLKSRFDTLQVGHRKLLAREKKLRDLGIK